MSKKPVSSRLIAACPVYYGWVVLAVGSLGSLMTTPGQTPGFSAFLDHFINDLGLSRSLISTLYTGATLTASFALPLVGRQFDQRGARFMIGLISLLLGLACLYMAWVHNAWTLVLGFFLLRLLGQGSLSLVSKNAINLWWVRRRGMAMGIAGLVTALLGGLFPLLINYLIPLYGWRATYMVLGGLILLTIAPLGWILMRNRPEDHGLEPDGGRAAVGDSSGKTGPIEHNWTLAQVLRAPVFWLVAAGIGSMSMLNTGLTFHLFSVFADSGLSSQLAASVFVPIALTGALVQLAGGLLIDRAPIRLLLVLALVLEAVVLLWAPRLTSLPMAYGFGICMGVQGGLDILVGSVIFANYFGRRHLGSIAGFASTLMVACSALGPMPIGIARDLLGSYSLVLSYSAALPLGLAIACLFFAKTPQAPPEH
ncbi:MAG: MFS transporter [Candidatus Latescibacteria bacterium]|nr:MFS transporter [Candidatus Latescibacterota bacterium]